MALLTVTHPLDGSHYVRMTEWRFELWEHPNLGSDVSRGNAYSPNASELMCVSLFLIKPTLWKEGYQGQNIHHPITF